MSEPWGEGRGGGADAAGADLPPADGAEGPADGSTLPVEHLRRLIGIGRMASGSVTVDEVLVALGSPEPTPEFIAAITELLAGQGIAVDPEEPIEDLQATPPEPTAPAPTRSRRRPGSSARPARARPRSSRRRRWRP